MASVQQKVVRVAVEVWEQIEAVEVPPY